MINKKSQTALEFLLNYGWAILVVLVAVGILSYLGVFNHSDNTDQLCTEFCNLKNMTCKNIEFDRLITCETYTVLRELGIEEVQTVQYEIRKIENGTNETFN